MDHLKIIFFICVRTVLAAAGTFDIIIVIFRSAQLNVSQWNVVLLVAGNRHLKEKKGSVFWLKSL